MLGIDFPPADPETKGAQPQGTGAGRHEPTMRALGAAHYQLQERITTEVTDDATTLASLVRMVPLHQSQPPTLLPSETHG